MSWALEVKAKDNWKCRICGSKDSLHAHHLYSRSNYPSLSEVVKNGVTLCESHHREYHGEYGNRCVGEKFLQ